MEPEGSLPYLQVPATCPYPEPIERETLQFFFYIISQMLNMSTFGNTADVYAIVHLVPHACKHIMVDHVLLLLSPSGKSGQPCARAFP
jgi:hypothetical protein